MATGTKLFKNSRRKFSEKHPAEVASRRTNQRAAPPENHPTGYFLRIFFGRGLSLSTESVGDLSALNGGGQVGRGNRHEVVLGPGEAVYAQHNLLRRKELTKTTMITKTKNGKRGKRRRGRGKEITLHSATNNTDEKTITGKRGENASREGEERQCYTALQTILMNKKSRENGKRHRGKENKRMLRSTSNLTKKKG